jgi:hypothetical protein
VEAVVVAAVVRSRVRLLAVVLLLLLLLAQLKYLRCHMPMVTTLTTKMAWRTAAKSFGNFAPSSCGRLLAGTKRAGAGALTLALMLLLLRLYLAGKTRGI